MECIELKKQNDESKKNLIDLAEKYQDLLGQIDQLQNNLNENNLKLQEKLNQFEDEKQKYENQMNDNIENEKKLTNQVKINFIKFNLI